MNSPAIVVVDPLTHFSEAIAADPELTQFDIIFSDASPTNSDETISRCAHADIVITNVITNFKEPELSQLPRLRTLVTASIGTNHIDLDYCRQHGIEVVRFPGFCAPAVAEMAFGLMLSLIRTLPEAQVHVLENHFDTQAIWGTELRGKVLGVVGAGDIGKRLIRIGKGFEMHVKCHTAHPSQERAQELGIVGFSSKEEVFCDSDFIILAIPATAETENFVSDDEIGMMKKSSYLINVARYQLVDLDAVARALNENLIAGFATDVPGAEPFLIKDAPEQVQIALTKPNVLVVPHIGGNTYEADEDLYSRMVAELKRLIATHPPTD